MGKKENTSNNNQNKLNFNYDCCINESKFPRKIYVHLFVLLIFCIYILFRLILSHSFFCDRFTWFLPCAKHYLLLILMLCYCYCYCSCCCRRTFFILVCIRWHTGAPLSKYTNHISVEIENMDKIYTYKHANNQYAHIIIVHAYITDCTNWLHMQEIVLNCLYWIQVSCDVCTT